ncbi:MAG: phosphoglucosamine mutase [Nitrososphaerales archaeon]
MARLFGTNGIRGVFGRDLTLDLALEVSYTLATYFRDKPVLVGYDGRHSSVALSKVVRAGLNSLGVDVADAGLVPTPCLQYCVKRLGYRGGVMITASHNPPEYNGMKVMARDGVELSREEELRVEEIYFSKKFGTEWDAIGDDVKEERTVDTYIDGVLSLVDVDLIRSKRLTVVLDVGNGAQAVAAPKLMESLGCRVITINSAIDGSFPARGSEPTPHNLSLLSQTVRDNSADLGIAFDGDGDRSIFCSDQGEVYGGDKSGAILTEHVLSKNREKDAKVVTPINSSALIDIVAGRFNAEVIKTKVGSVEVSRKMLGISALVGLEENGGFMYAKHIPVRDGAMSGALMLEAVASRSKRLSELVNGLPTFYQYKTKFACTKEESRRIVERLVSKAEGKRIETLDGVKIWVTDTSWAMVRQSGTEPVLRLYAESDDGKFLDEIVQDHTKEINSVIKG